jgi:hypothetical protein
MSFHCGAKFSPGSSIRKLRLELCADKLEFGYVFWEAKKKQSHRELINDCIVFPVIKYQDILCELVNGSFLPDVVMTFAHHILLCVALNKALRNNFICIQ